MNEWTWAIGLALMLIIGVDLLTNTLDTTFFEGDFVYYIDMAENGVFDNPALVAPFAYRPLTPFLAGTISNLTGSSIMVGYQVIAWVGAFLTLMSTYLLARSIGRKHISALLTMVVIGFTFYHVKYLLFDVYRPDHLAYGLMSLAFLALLQRRYWLCIGLSAIGALTREFTLVPLALLIFQQMWWLVRDRDGRSQAFLRLLVSGLVIVICVVLPRLLIKVESTVIYATLFTPDPTPLETVTLPLTSFRRNLNLIFALLAYSLPILWLGGWKDIKKVWRDLGEARALIGGYICLVLGLTLIGGTDLARFVTYLHVPLIILVVSLLDTDTPFLLIIGMIVTLLIFNRIPFPIPQDNYNSFIDFYGAYHDRINPSIITRWQELVVFIFIATGFRGGYAIVERERQAKLSNNDTN